jgi:hypothetical protein
VIEPVATVCVKFRSSGKRAVESKPAPTAVAPTPPCVKSSEPLPPAEGEADPTTASDWKLPNQKIVALVPGPDAAAGADDLQPPRHVRLRHDVQVSAPESSSPCR